MTPPKKPDYEEENHRMGNWQPIAPGWSQLEAVARVMDEREKRYEEQFRAIRDSMALALASAEKAVLKAEGAADKRFDAVNEFRQTLSDQAAHFARADLVSAQFESIEKRLTELTQSVTSFHASQLSKSQAYSSGFGFIATGIGIAGAIVGAVVAIFFKTGGN